MKKYFLIILVLLILGLITWHFKNSSTVNTPEVIKQIVGQTAVPKFDHIVLIIMENKPYQSIIGSSNAPFINSLAQKYGLAGNYFAVTHPSLPNYLAIIGGSTFGIQSDCTGCFVDSPNLADEIEKSGKTWKAYMDGMPTSCFIGNSGNYAQKHNPFIYFNDIRNNKDRCKNIVPYSELSGDLANPLLTPNFIWITPDLCHDMHDCSIKTGDDWLSQQVSDILKSSIFTLGNSLLVITWDEAEVLGSNQIPTILIGPSVKEKFTSQNKYDHYSLLHTIESAWGLNSLTQNDKNAASMSDFFK